MSVLTGCVVYPAYGPPSVGFFYRGGRGCCWGERWHGDWR